MVEHMVSSNEWATTMGVGVTIALAGIGFAIQWGWVNSQLANIAKRLDELIAESRSIRHALNDHERRISTVEGRCNQRSDSCSQAE